jgi:WD40 repeat protein
MKNLFDAFISYGRADSKAFATKLHARLLEQGLKVWFDQNDIPLGVDFQNQIDDGIEKAHNFLFIIAPHSINSPYCGKEIELALKRNKRIIPLLHVEQINQKTWQQRFPKGTIQEWEAYKAKGLHSSFPNMHPAIGKINWVYFREGIDDFEASFTGLMNLLGRHRDYVENHSQFLTKALEWERHQKQTSYLLIGEERQQAESWFKIRFKDEQAPCHPTDLHCEYITESIKNANNLMTQVFISYADEDRTTMEKIRNSLRRESITVWTNKTDIQTGEAFEEAINRGIEQADNLVFLLSSDSVNSTYCQRELDLAVSLNKRIIPLLVQETDPNQVPIALRELQYIDLTDNVKEDDYLLDESQLLKIFHEDAAYYNEHKILLTKALKWKRQHENPSILLRGYNLRSAEAWLKVSQKRTQHPPISLQEEFIAESLRQPPASSLDVFVSYSRADADFARKLNDTLQIQGKTTWFDQESIASGSDFQQEIYRGIKACDNFLFILSPRSVNSPYCKDEVEYAASLNKRFVTLLHREVNAADLHTELAKVQWIDFNHNERDFNANFNQLVRTLDTDREHVHNHSKWLQRAIEWQEKDKSADLLLRGNEFAIAQNWLQEADHKNKRPAATPLQKEFLLESGNAIAGELKQEKRRVAILRLLLGVATIGFLVSVGLGWMAKENLRKAEKRELEAYIATSEARLLSGQPFQSLLIGLRAAKKLKYTNWMLNDKPLQSKVVSALQQSLYQVKEINTLEGHDGQITDVHFSDDGKTIATVGQDKKVNFWGEDGSLFGYAILQRSDDIAQNENLMFSPDGQTIVAATKRNVAATNSKLKKRTTVTLWQQNGTLISTLDDEPQGLSGSWSFSPDGQTIATLSSDNKTIKLWRANGIQISKFKDEEGFGWFRGTFCHFSADGQIIATVGYDETEKLNIVKLRQRDGNLITTLKGHEGSIQDISFSRDGQIIVTASDDKTVKFWRRDGKEIAKLEGTDSRSQDVTFSPNGQIVAALSADNTVKLWQRDGKKESATLKGHEGDIYDVSFSRDGQKIATASADKTVKLWGQDGTLIATLTGHGDWVRKVKFSPDGNRLVSLSDDKTVKLWSANDDLPKTIELSKDSTIEPSLIWSPDRGWTWGQTFATIIKNGSVKLWKSDGTFIKNLSETSDGDVRVRFFNKGQFLVIRSNKDKESYGPAQLWKADGTPIRTLIQKNKGEGSVYVGSGNEGQTIATSINTEESYGPVQLWKANGIRIKTIIEKTKGKGSVYADVSNNGQTIVTGIDEENSYGPVQVWKADGTLMKTLISKSPNKGDVSVSFSNDGTTIVTTISDENSNGPVQLWNSDGTPLATLMGKSGSQEQVILEFSNDGQAFVTLNYNYKENSYGPVKLWKADGTLVSTLIEKSQEPMEASFSNDSQIIVTSVKDGPVQSWKADGTPIATLIKKSKGYTGIMGFSPDNQTVALLNEKTIELLNVDGTKKIDIPTEQNGVISKVIFSPNNQMIASASYDNTIKLWNLDGTPITTFTNPNGVTALNFSADGKMLTSIDEKNTVIVRRLDGMTNLDNLRVKGCEWMKSYLQTSHNLEAGDKHLCDGIGKK